MRRPNSPLVIIPNQELPIGTAKNLLKLLEKGKKKSELVPVAKVEQLYRQYLNNQISETGITSAQIPLHSDVYFHATKFERSLKILSSNKIKRRDKGHYKGAFVSTRPETAFGDFVFVFNRKIESSSPVVFSKMYEDFHWVGFSKSIPVNKNTLEYVAIKVNTLSEKMMKFYEEILSNTAGRKINVIPLDSVSELIKKRTAKEGVFIPEKWPIVRKEHTEWFQRALKDIEEEL
jgi:hypothetical protein